MSEYKSDGERIYYLWDKYARERDADGLVSLYAADATQETPVITAIFDTDTGVVQGHAELRPYPSAVVPDNALQPTAWRLP